MDCIFCKIVSGEIPSKKVYEDNDIIAFLDINPANQGHTLVIPKKHFESIHDIDDDTLKKLVSVVKLIADRIKNNLNADGINIIQNNGQYAGQLVNHIHFHIIPRFKGDNVVITYQRKQLTEQEFEEIKNHLTEKTYETEDYLW